jgi:hypothetical protein
MCGVVMIRDQFGRDIYIRLDITRQQWRWFLC